MLLTRHDGDGDGDLDLAAQVGFRGDPSNSAIAQRFAREVIERGRIVKEDGVRDAEIDNLIAIPIYVQDRFSGVVVAADRPGGVEELEDDVLLALGDQAGAVLQNARLTGELRDAYVATVSMLADALEAKDPFLRTHGDDAAEYVTAVAARLGFEPKRREQLVFASLLHDIGKLGITERILLKPAELTREERSVIELHPRIGFRIVEQVPALRDVAAAVLHHHERWDGGGYPSGLKGEEIPVEARLVAIADAFSAMTSDRPYRGRRATDDALEELERCAGTQFDPQLVQLFVEEVRNDPPREEGKAALARALDDPELQVRRRDQEPLLGYGTLARTDNLTLLYSHRHCRETIDAETARAEIQNKPFAVIAVEVADIDRINSDQGYAAGDDALRTVADAVQAAAADGGGTACRFSGSRMLLIAPLMGDRAADRVRDEIASTLAHGPSVRCAHVVWRPGETSDAVLARLEVELATATQRALTR
jgi:diguanylate cyclase (GGDEF)-like protein